MVAQEPVRLEPNRPTVASTSLQDTPVTRFLAVRGDSCVFAKSDGSGSAVAGTFADDLFGDSNQQRESQSVL